MAQQQQQPQTAGQKHHSKVRRKLWVANTLSYCYNVYAIWPCLFTAIFAGVTGPWQPVDCRAGYTWLHRYSLASFLGQQALLVVSAAIQWAAGHRHAASTRRIVTALHIACTAIVCHVIMVCLQSFLQCYMFGNTDKLCCGHVPIDIIVFPLSIFQLVMVFTSVGAAWESTSAQRELVHVEQQQRR